MFAKNRSQFPTSYTLLLLPLPSSKLAIREIALGLGLGFVIELEKKHRLMRYFKIFKN